MNLADLKAKLVAEFDGTVVMENQGDLFFIYDPAGDLPDERKMPFVTVVTGNHYDTVSNLDRPGAYRLNIGLTKATYTARFGAPPTERDEHWILDTGHDHAAVDVLMPHPMYASQYWVSVVDPSDATMAEVDPLLTEAHAFAARKYVNARSRRGDV